MMKHLVTYFLTKSNKMTIFRQIPTIFFPHDFWRWIPNHGTFQTDIFPMIHHNFHLFLSRQQDFHGKRLVGILKIILKGNKF